MTKVQSKAAISTLIGVILITLSTLPLFCDDRDENIDVFIVLDKSLSMVEEIGSVRDYVQDTLVDEIIIPGDQLVLITFFGQAVTLFAGDVSSDKEVVRTAVASIEADGRFTDIGNALDELRDAIPQRETEGRRRYLLLITDGKQEAPPESKYYSTEIAFNHAFLENAKEIRMAGWKIHILGVGTASAARELAEKLSGTYNVVTTGADEDESVSGTAGSETDATDLTDRLNEATVEFLGVLEIQEPVTVRGVDAKGESSAVFTLVSTGYKATQRVSVDSVTLELADGSSINVSDSPVTVEVEPESATKVKIPLTFEPVLEPGTYDGILTFWFDGSSAFTPGSVRVQFKVKTFLANNIWILPVALVVLAALVVGAMLLGKRPKSMNFLVEIDDGPLRKRGYKLKFGDSLYIIDGVMGFNILPKAGQTPAAKLTADGGGLHLSITDKKQFTVPSIPGNLLGNRLEVRKKNGRKATLSFDSD